MADIGSLLERFGRLKSARTVTDSYWQQVADFMIPSREFTRRSLPGSRRTAALIYNTAPILALEQLAGALHGMLTSPSLRWFALRSSDLHLMEDDDVRRWFENATDAMYGVFTSAEAGFDVALHEQYLDLSGFGNGVLYIADRGRMGPHYEARPLSECFFAQGADGEIDTLFRSYDMPVREVVTEWPKTVPKATIEMASQDLDRPVAIVHATVPQKDDKGTGWKETYILVDQKTCLSEGQYATFPYAVSRWAKRSGETYGYGPGMNALPDVKLINKLEEITLRGASKAISPPLMVPDDGFLSTIKLAPDSINYFRAGAPQMDKVGPLQTGARPDIGNQSIDRIQERIRRIFYVDWMSLPQQPNMTATEVLQRRDEMLRLLGPMVARVTRELLAPLIKRTFFIMAHNGMFPPLPTALQHSGYQVEYLSPLATAQRASDAENVMRWLAAMAQLAQIDATAMDVVDAEGTARFLAARYGAPAAVLRSTDEIKARAAARAQQQQQQHEMMAVQSAAGAARDGAGALAQLASATGNAGQATGEAPSPVQGAQ